ncbi:GyrI-like domain-containing protein [Actinoplanes teichomyceticus]|uniref:Effector-binding domain-containing protein n=1 Tax=Actinoplanes teichomyceticus TaxID=1867 RepID=A0A561VRE7_ACTTI|nr:GyrI-like domain-containing protein [Actinoplanes teichomyceticus]TWG14186.1 effector-binding domain-containing protein [Actinoplanes teichomyceticus]
MEPTIVRCAEQLYIGRRESIAMIEFARVADHLPTMFSGLAERGVPVTGAPFFRYRMIDMAAEMVVEAGIPVAAPVRVEPPDFMDRLPAGRYATVTHVGHPDQLMGVTARLLDWGQRNGLTWDMTPTPTGELWNARVEMLMTNPAEQPDMHKWETVLLFKLAD